MAEGASQVSLCDPGKCSAVSDHQVHAGPVELGFEVPGFMARAKHLQARMGVRGVRQGVVILALAWLGLLLCLGDQKSWN